MAKEEFLETQFHRLYVSKGGLTIFSTENLNIDDEEEDEENFGSGPPVSERLALFPAEAIAMAQYILARQAQLESQQVKMDTDFEIVSEHVLARFPSVWEEANRNKRRIPSNFELQQWLGHAFNTLVIEKSGQFYEWYRETFGGRFDHDQIEQLFWRYFHRHHWEALAAQYLSSSKWEKM